MASAVLSPRLVVPVSWITAVSTPAATSWRVRSSLHVPAPSSLLVAQKSSSQNHPRTVGLLLAREDEYDLLAGGLRGQPGADLVEPVDRSAHALGFQIQPPFPSGLRIRTVLGR